MYNGTDRVKQFSAIRQLVGDIAFMLPAEVQPEHITADALREDYLPEDLPAWFDESSLRQVVDCVRLRLHETRLLTLANLAAEYGLCHSTLRRACIQGRLRAKKYGRTWFSWRLAIEEALAMGTLQRRPGRPRKQLDNGPEMCYTVD